MHIALHKNARTTPAVRAQIAASDETASVLAQRFGITEQTVYKWKKRDSVYDRSHTAHRLQTQLTPAQEIVVVHLRRALLLPLDDLLAVTHEFISDKVSRSGLDRCLRRHGVGNLNALKPAEPAQPHKAFKSYVPGYLHIDVKYLPQMQDETKRRYLFVAIDRATRWVFVQIKPNKTAANAKAFLKALHKACPIKITRLLTDNGKEFTDRLFASREREPSGNHEFDLLCQQFGIEHRLTRPRTPKTNGMVERFNGRIADVLKTHRFNSAEDLEQTLLRYVALYNHQLPQSALQSKTPLQAMRQWHQTHPQLFNKRPYDRPGCDSYGRGFTLSGRSRRSEWRTTMSTSKSEQAVAHRQGDESRQFRFWSLEDRSSVAALFTECRRGIYVLHFDNGERYVGQATNVVTRYTTHRHGSKHHAPWKDIAALEFLEVPTGDLDTFEKATIHRYKTTHTLRNKLFNFAHWEPCTLDPVVTPEAQRHWATGQPSYDLTPFIAAVKRPEGSTPKLLSKKRGQERLPDGRTVGEVVIDELAQVVLHIIPNAVETEACFWSISDYPETAGGRFATLNVGWLELAAFPRRRWEAEVGSLASSNQLMWFLNAEIETFVAEDEIPDDSSSTDYFSLVEEIEGVSVYFDRSPDSYSVPVDRIMLPLGAFGIEGLDAKHLVGVRRLAIHAMRTGSARVNARSYSPELTRRVYERIVARRAEGL